MEKQPSERFDSDIRHRLKAVEGHVGSITTMIDNEKSCEEILIQLSAIESSVNKIAKIILKNHLNNCVKESIINGESDILDRFNNILDKYI